MNIIRALRVELTQGLPAHVILEDTAFVAAWLRLHGRCPHATSFQAPGFVCAWYGAYSGRWTPVVLRAMDADGELVGLWLLALDPASRMLVHAGAHHAEYHAWLAVAGQDEPFLAAAWDELKRQIDFAKLQFKYLPSAELSKTLFQVPGIAEVAALHIIRRPLLRLDSEQIHASFAKKSNKSRFNRIRKLGALETRRVTDGAELHRVFDEIIDFYDFRQGAMNQSVPFRQDQFKQSFHAALFANTPDETYITITYLDERPIAALWGLMSGKTLHLGILMYSPFFAEYSPGKLHVMQLSKLMLSDGLEVLDLTPGGDLWKERFANEHDDVAEAMLYRSATALRLADTSAVILQFVKRSLAAASICPDDFRLAWARLRRARPSKLVRKITEWIGATQEFRVYRVEQLLAPRFTRDQRVSRNSLSDLLCFAPGESWQSSEAFLSSALSRLERGESVFTVRDGNVVAHSGWMAVNQRTSRMTEVGQSMTFPPGSVALYDFYSHPTYRGQGYYQATIGHMLSEAFKHKDIQYAYISVLANNLPSRHVIEKMGFEYQGSFFRECRFGTERKWKSPGWEQAEPPDA